MKTLSKKHKLAIGLSAVILLFLTGVSYGAWSDTLSLRGIFTTANFSLEFGDKDDIDIDLIKADAKNNITAEGKVTEFVVTENGNKNIALSLKGDIINRLKEPGCMLRVKYPVKASDGSKIKAIKPEQADFGKLYKTVDAIPDYVKVSVDGKEVGIIEKIDMNDYEIRFNIYRQIETDGEKSTAVIFLKADGFNETPPEIGSVEYEDLIGILPDYTGLLYDNTQINAQTEAKYSLEIPITAEQFNSTE